MLSWQIRERKLSFDRPLVMGILNVTPDSFSDGGRFQSVDDAVRQAEKLIADGADILDIGGESTRPGDARVNVDEETLRVVPVIKAITGRHQVPISIDTTKADVATAAIDAGAVIINDISGLRFDERLAIVAGETGAGLVLMHSRGAFETMHTLEPVEDIFSDVTADLRRAVKDATSAGVSNQQIVLDVGIGFGKTQAQNLDLIANLGKLKATFRDYPFLAGASRKSFIGKMLDGSAANERLASSLAAAVVAVWNGADILRVHDVKETVEALKVVQAIKSQL